MPKTVKENRMSIHIRVKPSFTDKVKQIAKDNNITATEIYEKGAKLYMKYLEEKEAETV
jgi:hypothetical protein